MLIAGSGSPQIRDNIISDNTSSTAGGIRISNTSTPLIRGTLSRVIVQATMVWNLSQYRLKRRHHSEHFRSQLCRQGRRHLLGIISDRSPHPLSHKTPL
jgi:hypothetical protein